MLRVNANESDSLSKPDQTPPLDSGEGVGRDNDSRLHSPVSNTEEEKLARQGDPNRSLAVVAGMGFELAGTTVVFAGIGHLVDRYCGVDRSIGFAIGGLIGFGIAMFRFILKALRQIEESNA